MAADATGTLGTVTTQSAQLIDSAPVIRFQQRLTGVTELWNPDADGFYWGLSGTASAPVYELNCYEGVSFTEDLTVNDVQCDRQGNIGSIRKRNKLTLQMTLKTILPLATVANFLKLQGLVTSGDYQKAGIGILTNNLTDYFRIWMPKVYDPIAGRWIGIMLHRAIVNSAFNLQFTYANAWTMDVTIDAYADNDMPDNQTFATIINHDQDLY